METKDKPSSGLPPKPAKLSADTLYTDGDRYFSEKAYDISGVITIDQRTDVSRLCHACNGTGRCAPPKL